MRIVFYLADFLRTQAQEAAFQITQMDRSEEVRQEPRYKGIVAKNKKNIKKTQKTQVVGTSKNYC